MQLGPAAICLLHDMKASVQRAARKYIYEYLPLDDLSKAGAAAGETESEDGGNEPQETWDYWCSGRFLWLRRLVWTIHAVLLVPALYGIYALVMVRRGAYIATPIYSDIEIAQAGWSRPTLSAPPNSSLLPLLSNASPSPRTILEIYNMARAPDVTQDTSDLHVLILTPLRNAVSVLPVYFGVLDSLDHPKENTSLGFLIGDEEDDTAAQLVHWCREEQQKGLYRRLTLLRRDYRMPSPGGEARHNPWLQAQRRWVHRGDPRYVMPL